MIHTLSKLSFSLLFFLLLLFKKSYAHNKYTVAYQAGHNYDVMKIKSININIGAGLREKNTGITVQTAPKKFIGFGSGLLFNQKLYAVLDSYSYSHKAWKIIKLKYFYNIDQLTYLEIPIQFYFYPDKAKNFFVYIGLKCGFLLEAKKGKGIIETNKIKNKKKKTKKLKILPKHFVNTKKINAILGIGYEFFNGIGIRLQADYRIGDIYTEDFLKKYTELANHYPLPPITLQLNLSYNFVKFIWWIKDRK